MLYDWKRYWYERGDECVRTEGGYLVVPEREESLRLTLAPLGDFANVPCLVLLGEPGIGKSTEFGAERDRLAASGEIVHWVDLKNYQSDGLLVKDAFEDCVVQKWREGSDELHLCFDSLDEGRLEIRSIGNVLSHHLKKLQPNSARLRLKIACRTAEWPTSLEETLKEIWKEENVRVQMLAPLRRVDVLAAANAEGIDPHAFLTAVEQADAQPFAANPITLKFLLRTYQRTGSLPRTKVELYERGCQELCKEVSPTRLDSGHKGALSPSQRVKIAERIAAALVFSGRPTIALRPDHPIEPSAVATSEFAGGFEQLGEDRFDVTEPGIEEVLQTPLFVGAGDSRVGFAHRTYPEFLAARHITSRNLDATQIDSLLFHAEDPTKIVPQLAETAAWAATMDRRLYGKMLANDPETLLRSDIATCDDARKCELVSRLLEKFDAGELDDIGYNIRANTGKLAHGGIVDQLRPVLQDKQKKTVSRNVAIDIVEACRVAELLDVLASIVLDAEDEPYLRRRASYALQRVGDEAAIIRLRPLVLEERADDPDDELRGNALRALWSRRLLTADELFRSIGVPKERSLIGAYRLFVSVEMSRHLQVDDLPHALEWCKTYFTTCCRDVVDAQRSVVALAIRHLDQDFVLSAFADLLVAQIDDLDQAPIPMDEWKLVSDEVRHVLLERIVPRIDVVQGRQWQLFCFPMALIRHEDLPWLVNKASTGIDEERQKWATLVLECFEQGNRADVERILEACEANPLISNVFSPLLRAVDLDSEEAIRFRQMHVEHLDREERRKKRKEEQTLVPPPAERVAECLDLFEAGDLKGWWYLNLALQLAPEDTQYYHDLVSDLTTLPGWLSANDATKDRIRSAAQKYILEWTPDYPSWLGTNTIHHPDWAAYRALVLVEKVALGFLSTVTAEIWAKCAPAIAGFPINAGLDSAELQAQSRLLGEAYRRAPKVVTQAVLQIIDRENRQDGVGHLSILLALDYCTDGHMTECLLTKARDPVLKAPCVASLIGHAIEVWPEQAERVAHQIFAESLKDLSEEPQQERARDLRRTLGALLWQRGKDRWELLWPHFERDSDLFREVMLEASKEHGFRRIGELSEEQLAELFLKLSEEFPRSEDTNRALVAFPGAREMVASCRDSVLTSLGERGTNAAVAQVKRILEELPDGTNLRWLVLKARRVMLLNTWQPISVESVLALTRQPESRLVRNERELQCVVLESLQTLQERFHGETPSVRDVWDKRDNRGNGKWHPIVENEFSDYVKRHLEIDLSGRGIVALREVEVRARPVGEGERSDLYVTASVNGSDGRTVDTVRVIVEVKGCWHPGLKTAMESQLRDRYLEDNDCNAGIYVVAWFSCDAWECSDSRKGKTPKWTVDEAKSFFDRQAEELSADKFIRAFVFDVSLK